MFSYHSLLGVSLALVASHFLLHKMGSETKLQKHIIKSSDLGDFVASLIEKTAKQSIAERGIFTLGVSGGSIINIISQKLTKRSVDWSKWKIFFCDERKVPFSDSESTFGQYKKNVIDQVGFIESWVAINPELELDECAKDYEEKMHDVFEGASVPSFDMLLLGMGPDGHTCSLFPGHQLLQENELHVASINDSPKPPPARVTMTLPVLNAARNAVFISAGASKASTIKMVFDEDSKLPASLVKPTTGNLIWIMDDAAASQL